RFQYRASSANKAKCSRFRAPATGLSCPTRCRPIERRTFRAHHRNAGGTPALRLGRLLRRADDHAERIEIDLKHGFLLFALMAVLLADRDDLAQGLGIE